MSFAACVTLLALSSWETLAPVLGGGGPPSTIPLAGSVLLVVQLVQAALASSRRDVVGAAPLLCLMLLQAGMAMTSGAAAVPLAIAMCVTLCAMVAGLALTHHADLLDGAGPPDRVEAHATRSSAWLGFGHIVRVAALSAMFFALLPHAGHLGVRTAGARAASAATAGSAGHSDALADPSAGSLDLRLRGPLSDAPVFVTDASAPAYWQSVVYDHYDGSTWTITGPEVATTWTAVGPRGARQQSPPLQLPGAPPRDRVDSVQLVSPTPARYVFAPGQAIAYVGPGTIETDAVGNAVVIGPSSESPATARNYDVTSVESVASPEMLATAAGADPDDPRWLQLPAGFPTRVGALATRLAGVAPTRAAAVDTVEEYLREHEKYDLAAPLPAPGEDAVDDFLFDSHVGFCEQFASAAVVMLRSLGIPARLVTGYAHGDAAAQPGRIVMRGIDAHAWVQVWYPGIGWVASDPTPPSTLSPSVTAASATAPSDAMSARGQWALLGVLSELPDAAREHWRETGGVGVVVAIAFLAQLPRRRRRAVPSPAVDAVDGDGPVLRAYLRLVDTHPATASRRWETVREAAARLDVTSASPPSVRHAFDAVERECYGGEALPRPEVDAAIRVFDTITAAATGSR